MRSEYADFRCAPSTFSTVTFPGDGEIWNLPVAEPTVEAWEAFTRVMTRHEVLFLESIGGTYSCRFIGGTTKWSAHAFGIALDLNPSQNPQKTPLTTVFTEPFIAAVKGLVTASGRRVFEWGGDWSGETTPDPMHFQIGATRAELATGIIDPMEEDMPLNDDDLDTIRAIVRDEIARNHATLKDDLAKQLLAIKSSITRNNRDIREVLTQPRQSSPIGRAVFDYMRGFTPDDVAKTLRRIDRNTQPSAPPRRRGPRVRGEEETFTGGVGGPGEDGDAGRTRRRSTGRTGSEGTPPVR